MMFNWIKNLFKRPKCYRCGGKRGGEYMGLTYCALCLEIVPMMASMAQGNPGFPLGPPGVGEIKEK